MAIGSLADLEEISPVDGRPSSLELFQKAIQSAQTYYDNAHVYPFTYLGGFHYRHGNYKQALVNWAAAAQVIARSGQHPND